MKFTRRGTVTVGHRNFVNNNQNRGDDNNDISNIDDVYVWNSFCDTSAVSAVELIPGDADYEAVESLNPTGTEAEFFNGRALVIVVSGFVICQKPK